ncbi:ribonuclease E [Dorcoceras hygrometricum]|uniref:Ribonuclease E n=1 Tax=Dorcoceras hygrometricum TaxID=472368 RepID=A0A2Z7CSZ4_9LAMI|nr:ribonuclease E [Dorcoceras hygrometricum]
MLYVKCAACLDWSRHEDIQTGTIRGRLSWTGRRYLDGIIRGRPSWYSGLLPECREHQAGSSALSRSSTKIMLGYRGSGSRLPARKRHFTVGGDRYRQSGQRPETGFLPQPALEGLTRSAWTDSPRQIGRNNFRRRGGGGGGVRFEERGRRLLLRVKLVVGPQPLWLRNHNPGLAQRIMVRASSNIIHDPLGITDSACKNQLVVVSVQYGPFNPYIPIRSTTIGKSRVVIDPIAMRTSWRSNSDITSVTRTPVKTDRFAPQHDPLGITVSACKNQLVVVSVQYGPFNPYIPIRSTTIGKSRVAIDPIAMRTSWRSNSDITSVTSIGYPRMSASGESSTTMHRLLHASGSHPIPTPYDPNVQVWCSSAESSCSSERLNELDVTPVDGDKEESCLGVRKCTNGLQRIISRQHKLWEDIGKPARTGALPTFLTEALKSGVRHVQFAGWCTVVWLGVLATASRRSGLQ